MTVTAQVPSYIQIPGNGTGTVFAFPFKCFAATDVIVGFVVNGLYTAQTGGFTVGSIDVNGGGTVTFTTPPPVGTLVDIRTVTPLTQITEFANLGAFLPEVHTDTFDRVVRELQDVFRRTYTFGIHGPDNEGSPWPALPAAAQRANTGLVFDANGLPAPGVLTTQPVTAGLVGGFLYPPLSVESGLPTVNTIYPYLNVKRYGAVGDGVTDDTVAIKTAWTVAKAIGGGTIVFPKATYLCASLDAATPSVNLPQQQTNGSQLYQPYQTQFYFQSGSNINFDFQGSVLLSTITGGGAFMMFDACTDIHLMGPTVVGQQVPSTGVVSLGSISGGSGYTNGTYANVLLTGGSGNGVAANVTVTGGQVTAVIVGYAGGNYQVGDVLSATAASIGGTGSGFSVPVTSVSGIGPVVQVAAPNCFVVTTVSGSSQNFSVTDPDISNMFVMLYCVDDPTLPSTLAGISVRGNARIQNCEYGIALHNGGDDAFIENLYVFRGNRPFFFYGVKNVWIKCVCDQIAYGFQPVVKAYSRSVRNITILLAMINAPGQSGSVARLSLQVQCDPAVISPAPTLQGVYIQYDEDNFSGNGGNGIEFDYFAGAGGGVQQSSTTSQLFNNIYVSGFSNSAPFTTVAQNSSPPGIVDFSRLQFVRASLAGNDPQNANGMVGAQRFSYSPIPLFGGGNTGMSFTSSGDYYVKDGICHVIGKVSITGNGSSTGAPSVTLPLPTRGDSSQAPLGRVLCQSGFASLTGPVYGVVASGTNTMNIAMQGTTGAVSMNTGNFSGAVYSFDVSYPV